MIKSETKIEPQKFRGAMRAGSFSAQLFVELSVTPEVLKLGAMGRAFKIERSNLRCTKATSILGIFKRGIRFVHNQPDVPDPIIFYPSGNLDDFRRRIHDLGWS